MEPCDLASRWSRGEVPANELRFAARQGDPAARAALGDDAPGPSQRIQLRRWSETPCACPTLAALIVERITGRHRPGLEGRSLLLVSDIAGDTREWRGSSAYELLDRFAEHVWEEFHGDAEVDFEIVEEEMGGDPDGEDLRALGPRLFLHWWLSGRANEGCACGPGGGSFRDDPRGALVVGWDTMPPVFEASWAILDPS